MTHRCKLVKRDGPLEAFVCTDSESKDSVFFELYDGTRPVGKVVGYLNKSKKMLEVEGADVFELEETGRGLGTILYEAALAFACKKKMGLGSSTLRSVFSEAFWRKQEQKGRATCQPAPWGEQGAYYSLPFEEFEQAYNRGKIPEHLFLRAKSLRDSVILDEYGGYDEGMWPCGRYAIDRGQTCKVETLRGLRGRKKRKR